MNFGKCVFTGHKTQESVLPSVYFANWSANQPTAKSVDFCLHPNYLHGRIRGQQAPPVWSHDRSSIVWADIRDVAYSDVLWGTHAVPRSHRKPSLALELCMLCYLGNSAGHWSRWLPCKCSMTGQGDKDLFCLCLLGCWRTCLLVLKLAQNT